MNKSFPSDDRDSPRYSSTTEDHIEARYENNTVWLTQKLMAELFAVDVRTISEHLKNIYETDEIQREATIRKFRTVQTEGAREVGRNIDFYNLDAIISVGYRVNSLRATQFRQWATQVLREFYQKITDIYSTELDYNEAMGMFASGNG